jgi:hypothetical protein
MPVMPVIRARFLVIINLDLKSVKQQRGAQALFCWLKFQEKYDQQTDMITNCRQKFSFKRKFTP